MTDNDSAALREQLSSAGDRLQHNQEKEHLTRRWGLILAVMLVFVVGGWASFAPLESAALAPGVVQVEGKRVAVQHLEGGIVREIFVSSGDEVLKGDTLVTFDVTKDKAELEILRGRYYNSLATLDRLRAERDDLATLIFSEGLSGALDPRAQSAMQSEKSLFTVRLADRKGEEAVILSQRKGTQAILDAKEAVAESLAGEIADLEELLAEGFIDKTRLRELHRSQAKIQGELADLRVSLDESELKILQLRKRFKTQVVDELAELLEINFDVEQQLTAINDKVTRATVKATATGVVLNRKPNNPGAVVSPGFTLMEIVPDATELVVEARISPMDIDRVMVGQAAEIRFAVFKDAYMVTGELVNLSADRLFDDASQMPYYQAEISLRGSDLQLLGEEVLIPGMPAQVIVKTGHRTMISYLTSPMRRIFSRSLTED